MFSRTSRPFVFSANGRLSHMTRDAHRRGYSVISTHSTFPATLLRPNAGQAYKPFWFERQARGNELHQNDVWSNCLAMDRATLMPNTFTMQEIIRTAVDNYFENKENGMSVEPPFIFTIPKGTTLPSTLVLLREDLAQFSLQPSLHISPNDLENILDEFYSKNAIKQDADEWLMDHNYEDAIAGEKEEEWMAR
ncbi:hypothetical protein CC80DRAFT_449014 [Byssothecium circinans]|uniref:Tse2 ADP-ribosyltransferase toxin domain-containing protein n=1 Tax=Byssothecium circinans TaxID=147558 RepID=A0A6A5TQH8_9PLEO|nr:hypothetical protein CC80DRAFT_449014 [Byssothecium circinans]